MTPARTVALLAPILDRMRTTDHWIVPNGGSPSHRTTPLTSALMINHVLRLVRVGLCPMQRGADTTLLALLDLDSHKGEVKWTEMIATARRLTDAAEMLYGIRLIPFRSSGGKGLHLYALWPKNAPQDARSVRAALVEVLDVCGLSNGTKGVRAGQAEVFPKSDAVPAGGWGSMVVIPMSGESVPLHRESLAEVHLVDVDWPDSDPVPIVAPAEYAVVTLDREAPELERLQAALYAIDPNELDYEGWLRMLFAVHDGTGGSAEGLALVTNWSSQWSGFDATASAAETVKQWTFAKSRPGGITVGSLLHAARRAGWIDPAYAPNADGFEPVEYTPPGAVRVGAFQNTEPPPEQAATPGTIRNLRMKLEALLDDRLAYDDFLADLTVNENGAWRRFTDEDVTMARDILQGDCGFKEAGKENVRDVFHLIGRARVRDSARDWLLSLPTWDGVPRIERFLPRYLGAADNEYTRAVGRYLLTALVGRVMEPGCQADMVPVMVGGQGEGKTRSVKALVPDEELYTTVDLSKRDEDQARLLRGKMIGEIEELRGLASRDHESIKAWLTRTHEEWTPKYRETNTRYARRCVFVGTTNQPEFLADETGNRRWLPFEVGRCDPEGVARDREQLLAEALVRWTADGIDYADAERLARNEHDAFSTGDEWDQQIAAFLDEIDRPFTVAEVAQHALHMEVRHLGKAQEMRVARVLKNLGCARHRVRNKSGGFTAEWRKVDQARPTVDDAGQAAALV